MDDSCKQSKTPSPADELVADDTDTGRDNGVDEDLGSAAHDRGEAGGDAHTRRQRGRYW